MDLEEKVLAEVHGGIWHFTHCDRYKKILSSGYIVPDPPIAEGQRWKTSRGPDYYPFVRKCGGVSLFDFRNFSPESYDSKFPSSTWRTFVPFRREWGSAVWIQINRELMAENFVNYTVLYQQQQDQLAYRHTLMPQIEAAHIGPIPICFFRRAFQVAVDCSDIEELAFS